MKRMYFLAVLLSIASASFAGGPPTGPTGPSGPTTSYYVYQCNWRWRNDNGSETTATWKALQSATASYNKSGVTRLRIEIVNTSRINPNNTPVAIAMNDVLQYSTTPYDESSWKTIGNDKRMSFVMAASDRYIKQDEATTAQIAVVNNNVLQTDYPYSPGKIMVSDSVLQNISVASYGRSEFEWAIKGTGKLLPRTQYYFRMLHLGGSSPYQMTYPALYPILITGALAAKPNGITADEDGNSLVSGIRATQVSGTSKEKLSVFPNPATSYISFRLNSTIVKHIVAMLTDANGRVVHQQEFENVQPGSINKLNLEHLPPPGLYILKLQGDGFSESSKVVIQ